MHEEINAHLSSSRVPRPARRMVNSLLNSRSIEPEALQWLLSAVDPFCDEDLTVVGMPTIRQARGVPQLITRTVSISQPTVLAGSEWECAVAFMPCMISGSDDHLSPASMASGVVSARTGPDIYSGLTVFAGPVNMDWGTITSANGEWHNSLAVPDNVQESEFRLTACGFEVVNTTAPLRRQGSVTVARVSNGKDIITVNQSVPATPVFMTGTSMLVPPTSQQALSSYPGSRTWEASKGVYCVCTMADPTNRIVRNVPSSVVAMPTLGPPPATATLSGWRSLFSASAHVADWDTSIAHFSGLSDQTTLQVTVRYYVERFPPPGSELVYMTQPPVPWSPLALELYSRGLRDLCCFVPQGENPLGEWLDKVLRAIGQYAPIIGGLAGAALGQPELAVLGDAAGGAATAIRRRRNPKKKKSQAARPKTKQTQTNSSAKRMLRSNGKT